MESREEHIRKRAHELWEKDGRPHGRHNEHWIAAEKELAMTEANTTEVKKTAKKAASKNEGEGNRTADRAYKKHVQETIKSGKVTAKAKEAAEALDGSEGSALKAAEEAGKKHAKS